MDEFMEFVMLAAMVVMATIIALTALVTVGAVYGAGVALWNYGLAFIHNVKPVKVAS